jgi:hypothetical protein
LREITTVVEEKVKEGMLPYVDECLHIYVYLLMISVFVKAKKEKRKNSQEIYFERPLANSRSPFLRPMVSPQTQLWVDSLIILFIGVVFFCGLMLLE